MLFGTKPPAIEWEVSTNIGKRPVNEDSVLAIRDGDKFLFVVSDGLGGHGMGKDASSLTVEVFRNEFVELSNCRGFLDHAFKKAQQAVLKSQKERRLHNQMKTTAAALVINKWKFAYGHIGDTRVYMYKNRKLVVRTLDHSVPQMLVLSGEINEDEIGTHPDRSRLLYVIGDNWSEPKYEISNQMNVRRGMAFFLATDGVWEAVPNPAPEEGFTPDLWMKSIIGKVHEACKCRDDYDNFSATAVMVR